MVVLWVARHIYKKKLSYIGYGGEGKQVRDILHIDDLYRLISMQIKDIGKFSGQTYNVGGGREVSISLKELTYLCQKYTGETIPIDSLKEDRTGDIPIYITDHKKSLNKRVGPLKSRRIKLLWKSPNGFWRIKSFYFPFYPDNIIFSCFLIFI